MSTTEMQERIERFVRNVWSGSNVAYCYLEGRRRVFMRFRWDPETATHSMCSAFRPHEPRVIRFCAPRVKVRVGSAAR
jgi:hypothetical protein